MALKVVVALPMPLALKLNVAVSVVLPAAAVAMGCTALSAAVAWLTHGWLTVTVAVAGLVLAAVPQLSV